MQVGAENRNKLIAAVALMVVAAALLGRWIFGSDGSPSQAASITTPTISETAESGRKPVSPRKTRGGKGLRAEHSLDPTLRYDWLKQSEDTQYKGSGRNIFQAQVDIPKPIAPVRIDRPAPPPVPQGPPPPPPIDLKFFGFASRPGEPKRVFLSQGEDVFIAGEGEIVDRRYKVLRISAASVEVEDVLNNNRQEIFLTQG